MICACTCSTSFNVTHFLKVESKVWSFTKLLLEGSLEQKKQECLEIGSKTWEILVLNTELKRAIK